MIDHYKRVKTNFMCMGTYEKRSESAHSSPKSVHSSPETVHLTEFVSQNRAPDTHVFSTVYGIDPRTETVWGADTDSVSGTETVWKPTESRFQGSLVL
jgi:hypothetical protein